MSNYPPVNRLWIEKLRRLQGEANRLATMPGDNEPLAGRGWLQGVADALQEARIIIDRLESERMEVAENRVK